tara:strand:- start:72 stop:302 length:231 start_codon:yes stop_codon:yes gene_type:complete
MRSKKININATLFGGFVIGLAVVMTAVSYYLGKRKTATPILAAIIGFFSAIIPPLALIYLIVLVLKRDIKPAQDNS